MELVPLKHGICWLRDKMGEGVQQHSCERDCSMCRIKADQKYQKNQNRKLDDKIIRRLEIIKVDYLEMLVLMEFEVFSSISMAEGRL